jgi:hypothetical protein
MGSRSRQLHFAPENLMLLMLHSMMLMERRAEYREGIHGTTVRRHAQEHQEISLEDTNTAFIRAQHSSAATNFCIGLEFADG